MILSSSGLDLLLANTSHLAIRVIIHVHMVQDKLVTIFPDATGGQTVRNNIVILELTIHDGVSQFQSPKRRLTELSQQETLRYDQE